MAVNGVKLGYNSFIGFTEVSTTAEVATTAAEFLFVDSFAFKREHEEQIQNAEIGIGDRSPRRRVIGNISANGTLTKNIDPNNGIALYQYLLGGSLTTASVGSLTFSHTFSVGDDVPSCTRLQFEISPGGDSNTTLRFFNGIVESYSLALAVNAPAKETWNLMFSDHSPSPVNTLSTVSLTETEPINFNRTSVRLGNTITAVSEVATKDITLNINNTLVEVRELGTNTVSEFRYDMRAIDGTMNLTFVDLDEYQTFVNNTATALQILMESSDITSSTNHSIQIDIPQAFFNGETPEVGGTGEIVQPINFSAIHGSNAGYMIKVTVINADSAVTK